MQTDFFARTIPLISALTCLATPAMSQVFTEQFDFIANPYLTQIDNGTIYTPAISMYNESDGSFIQTLTSPDLDPNDPNDLHGDAMDAKNGLVVATSFDHNSGQGAAFLFDAATGTQLQKFTTTDNLGNFFHLFGSSVALGDGLVAVGAPGNNSIAQLAGAVFIFDANTGAEIRKIVPSDGVFGSFFGREISIHNNILAVKSSSDTQHDNFGMVYLYDVTTGVFIRKFLPDDVALSNNLGSSIAIDGDTLVLGASIDDDAGENAGAVYVYDIPTGNLLHKILPETGVFDGAFGSAVAIQGDTIAIAEHNELRDADSSKTVYLYNSATAEQYAQLIPSNPREDDEFGVSIAISPESIAIGGIRDLSSGKRNRVFVYNRFSCAPDLNNDGFLDFNDISFFLSQASIPGSVADYNGDGVFDFFDISTYIAAYSAGCP